MKITLLGVGSAFDAYEANSSLLIEQDGFTLLIDCGHSAVGPLWRAQTDAEAVDAVFLTHGHGDHLLGVAPVLDRWSWEGRRRALRIVASEAVQAQLHQVLAAVGVAPKFPVAYAAPGAELGPFAVKVAPTQHYVPNLAVALRAGTSSFAFSGDGRPTAESRRLFAQADLLLQECYHVDAVPEDPGHCDLPTARAIAGPKRIGLYHVQAGAHARLAAEIADDERLFVAEAGQVIAL